jgi:mannosyltransferase OCH1-like enzyme
MIPKTIHYCWFGKGAKSDLNLRCIDSWRRVMPDYQIKEWNETNYPLDTAYSQKAYAKEFWSKLSNLARLQAVYTEGGIYLDTDVEVLKTFSPMLHHKCFLGFQVKEEQVDWVANGVLGAQAGHPFLKRCRELTLERFAKSGKFYRSPEMTTIILKEIGLKEYGLQEIEEVTIYPLEYFYPYSWTEEFSPECVKENTYSIHFWEGTWLKKEQSKFLSPLRKIKSMARALISQRHNS